MNEQNPNVYLGKVDSKPLIDNTDEDDDEELEVTPSYVQLMLGFDIKDY